MCCPWPLPKAPARYLSCISHQVKYEVRPRPSDFSDTVVGACWSRGFIKITASMPCWVVQQFRSTAAISNEKMEEKKAGGPGHTGECA